MPPILIIINFLAIAYAIFLLLVISHKYRYYFLLGCSLPLVIFTLVAYIVNGDLIFTMTNVGLFLLRGGLVASVLAGSLLNYLISKFRS